MRTLRFIFTIAFLLFFVSSSYGEELFICEDSAYSSDSKPNILESRYHLFQIFGDASFRDTNFFKDNYNGAVGWVEGRLIFPRFSEFISTHVPLPDPFLTGILKGLKDIDWEDRWDYGIGIEWRPLKRAEFLNDTFLNWTKHLRIYTVYLKTEYLQDREEWGWRPDDDFRIGVDLYRECNLYNENKYWGEFWSDISWRETNFYVDDYESWTFAFVPKLGIKLFPDEELAIMPYVTGEISLTEQSEFWQNRALAGLGLRFMPFRFHDDVTGIFIKGLRIYAEGLWVVDYFKDDSSSGTPDHDFRVGLNFTINWW